ncbi:hypothetical protein BaRGS_00020913 [Batillaria attramentaria]|uniref:Uncharacterized protein n=1 Tax=Batillaria attramentaria TaxID=370345 RepID=A0ABD0KLK3_9CAEN
MPILHSTLYHLGSDYQDLFTDWNRLNDCLRLELIKRKKGWSGLGMITHKVWFLCNWWRFADDMKPYSFSWRGGICRYDRYANSFFDGRDKWKVCMV